MPRKNDWLPFYPDSAAQAQGRNFPKILESFFSRSEMDTGRHMTSFCNMADNNEKHYVDRATIAAEFLCAKVHEIFFKGKFGLINTSKFFLWRPPHNE